MRELLKDAVFAVSASRIFWRSSAGIEVFIAVVAIASIVTAGFRQIVLWPVLVVTFVVAIEIFNIIRIFKHWRYVYKELPEFERGLLWDECDELYNRYYRRQ